jgi:ferrous iron transport protein B
MADISLQVMQPKRSPRGRGGVRIAMVGNPNCGKTTLFNRLTGLRAKTSNFPGTTLECRSGRLQVEGQAVELIDLPGLYSTNFAQSEEQLAVGALRGELPGLEPPDAVVLVIDATCLSRHLYLASEVRQMGVPMIVALNMMDEARREGLTICLDTLGRELDTHVVPVSGRSGEGIDALRRAVAKLAAEPDGEKHRNHARNMTERLRCAACSSCPHTNRHTWACGVSAMAGMAANDPGIDIDPKTEKVDEVLTHPVLGVVAFALIMTGLFILIFQVAAYPMDWIDRGVTALGDGVAGVLPEGMISSFLVDGVIGGVGGVLVFLPQICLLFFVLTLLEDTGYLARAAFVADRIMHKVGLPGKAFIPMLSAHACAIPAIMSSKVIESRRDRLITIMVLPLMTCSARLPVYAMITALLFGGAAVKSGLVFFAAYGLGIVAALAASLVLGKTVLKGRPQQLIIELPAYRRPSLRTALLTAWDRAVVFLGKAGGVILIISIGLWTAATFPHLPAEQVGQVATRADAARYEQLATQAAASDGEQAAAAQREMGAIYSRYALSHSWAGRVGKLVEPVFEPLGFDWRIDVGVMTSFAAREVIVSTLAVVAGIGEEGAEDDGTLIETMRHMKREDGSPLFTTATAFSLMVFFVLAMQCLPTQAVTKRETGSWKWAALQFSYMTALAYGASMITYQVVNLLVG